MNYIPKVVGGYKSLAPASTHAFMKQKLRWNQETGIRTNSDKNTNSEKITYFQWITRDWLSAGKAYDDTQVRGKEIFLFWISRAGIVVLYWVRPSVAYSRCL